MAPANRARRPLRLILGSMNFGPQVDLDGSRAMIETFLDDGNSEIDSAYVYNNGETERFLGEVLPHLDERRYSIATKVNPRITGRLDADAIRAQLDESLERMGRKSVDLLYLHFPDPNTPLETTLAACAEQHAAGKFHSLGLSNYPAWEVVHIWHLCDRNGWPKPAVYQGLYNALSRNVEAELLPALRRLGIRFYAYNPLAGGILAGKYANHSDEPAPGRFTVRPNYRKRYWKASFFDALDQIAKTCGESEISLVEASYRWLAHHSALTANDGVILGASSPLQLRQNLDSFSQEPLPPPVAEAFEAAWGTVRSDSPDYFRTPDQPSS